MNDITCKRSYSTERQLLPERKIICLSRFSKAVAAWRVSINAERESPTQSAGRPSHNADGRAGSFMPKGLLDQAPSAFAMFTATHYLSHELREASL